LQQVAGYHREWRAFFLGRVYRGEQITTADYADIPRFGSSVPAGWHRVGVRQLELAVAFAITSLMAFWWHRKRAWIR
jgi:hypothetical protein